jgi:hypothetical protein
MSNRFPFLMLALVVLSSTAQAANTVCDPNNPSSYNSNLTSCLGQPCDVTGTTVLENGGENILACLGASSTTPSWHPLAGEWVHTAGAGLAYAGDVGLGTAASTTARLELTTPVGAQGLIPAGNSALHIYYGNFGNGTTGVNYGGNIWLGVADDFVFDGGTDSEFYFYNSGASTGGTGFWSNSLSTPNLWLTNSGKVGIGTKTPEDTFDVFTKNSIMAVERVDAAANLRLEYRPVDSSGNYTAVPANAELGRLSFTGWGTTKWSHTTGYPARISVYSAETFTDSAGGTWMAFYTTPLGTNVAHEAMRLMPNGMIGINATAPQATLDVGGEVKIGNTGQECSSVNEGALQYDKIHHVMDYCNGTAWVAMSH